MIVPPPRLGPLWRGAKHELGPSLVARGRRRLDDGHRVGTWKGVFQATIELFIEHFFVQSFEVTPPRLSAFEILLSSLVARPARPIETPFPLIHHIGSPAAGG